MRKCEVCPKEFEANKNQKTCSIECGTKLLKMRNSKKYSKRMGNKKQKKDAPKKQKIAVPLNVSNSSSSSMEVGQEISDAIREGEIRSETVTDLKTGRTTTISTEKYTVQTHSEKMFMKIKQKLKQNIVVQMQNSVDNPLSNVEMPKIMDHINKGLQKYRQMYKQGQEVDYDSQESFEMDLIPFVLYKWKTIMAMKLNPFNLQKILFLKTVHRILKPEEVPEDTEINIVLTGEERFVFGHHAKVVNISFMWSADQKSEFASQSGFVRFLWTLRNVRLHLDFDVMQPTEFNWYNVLPLMQKQSTSKINDMANKMVLQKMNALKSSYCRISEKYKKWVGFGTIVGVTPKSFLEDKYSQVSDGDCL